MSALSMTPASLGSPQVTHSAGAPPEPWLVLALVAESDDAEPDDADETDREP